MESENANQELDNDVSEESLDAMSVENDDEKDVSSDTEDDAVLDDNDSNDVETTFDETSEADVVLDDPLTSDDADVSDVKDTSDDSSEDEALLEDAIASIEDTIDDIRGPIVDFVAPDNTAPIVSEIPISTTTEASPMTQPTPITPVDSKASDGTFEDYIIEPAEAWPPPMFIRKNASARERFYLEYRWHSQWAFYDSKASENKDKYYWFQGIVVIGALLIPALISLNSTIARFITEVFTAGGADNETIVRIAIDSFTVLVSLAVAGAAALESLYKYGENWSSYRSAAEELQAEKNFYDMSAGPYEKNPSAFATFVARIEGIVANQNGKYFQAVQQQIAKQTEDNEAIVDRFLSDDDDDDYGMPDYANANQSSTPDIG